MTGEEPQYSRLAARLLAGPLPRRAACVYLEPWHPDIEEFLELRDNTGEDARRAHNLNLANWIPDEFMRRVEADELWSLIDPDHRLHRRMLRVHRAAGLQPVQARNHVG
jgi:hypothetical protein